MFFIPSSNINLSPFPNWHWLSINKNLVCGIEKLLLLRDGAAFLVFNDIVDIIGELS
jgi:hypothetical protein